MDERDLGVAGAFQQMMTQLGVVVGIQVMQTVSVVRVAASGEVGAYGEAYLVGGFVAALGLVTALLRAARSAGRAEGAPEGALDEDPDTAIARWAAGHVRSVGGDLLDLGGDLGLRPGPGCPAAWP